MYHFSRQYLIIRIVQINKVCKVCVDKSNLIESLVSKVNALTLTYRCISETLIHVKMITCLFTK